MNTMTKRGRKPLNGQPMLAYLRVRIPQALKAKLEAEARAKGCDVAWVVRERLGGAT